MMKPTPDLEITTVKALKHVALVGLILCAWMVQPHVWGALWPTATGALARLQLFHGQDGVPVVRLFQRRGGALEFAGRGYGTVPEAPDPSPHTALRWEPQPEGGTTVGPRFRVDEKEYDGLPRELEQPMALSPFFERLLQTAKAKRSAKDSVTRISHYGDSSIATDLITHTARRRFQASFGDAGHGWILMSAGDMPYAHRDVRHRSSGSWHLDQVVAKQNRDGLYGYGGVAFGALPGATAHFGTDKRGPVGQRVSRYEVYYRVLKRGGKLQYRVDRGEKRVLSMRSETEDDRVLKIPVQDGPHSLRLKFLGGGRAHLYGVVMERDVPGVVYDSVGLVGARARRLLHFNSVHLRQQMKFRDPHLLILGFGGNTADDPVFDGDTYRKQFLGVIKRLRAGKPSVSCLIMAPLDQGQRNTYGHIKTLESLPKIVTQQRRAAREAGCAFYNTFLAMGGEGSMGRWYKERPRLALSDFRHATPAGYERIGGDLYRALMKSFAQWLERNRSR